MKIKNINERYGDAITFDSIDEFRKSIRNCGYNVPDDGLVEGRDYEVIHSPIVRITCTNGNRRNGIKGSRIRIYKEKEIVFELEVPARNGLAYCKKHPTGWYAKKFFAAKAKYIKD